MVEQGSFGCLDIFKLVHETCHTCTEHFIPEGKGKDIWIVGAPVTTPLVMNIMSAAKPSPCLIGPDFVVIVIWSGFSAETLGGNPRHVGLKSQHDQVGHQLNVFLKTVLGLSFETNLGFIEFRSTLLQDALFLDQPFLYVTNRM